MKDPLLAIVVVVLRNLPLMIVTLGIWDGMDCLAPAWVVVLRRADGALVYRIAAGRAEGAGEADLAAVLADLQSLDVQEFLTRHDPARNSGRLRRRRWKRGLRAIAAKEVAEEAEFRLGLALWWIVTHPFRFLGKVFSRGLDIT